MVDEKLPQHYNKDWNDKDLYFPEERILMMIELQIIFKEETELSKFIIITAIRSI